MSSFPKDYKKLDNKIPVKKENFISSLYEVEHFLCNFKKIVKSIKIYRLFKS